MTLKPRTRTLTTTTPKPAIRVLDALVRDDEVARDLYSPSRQAGPIWDDMQAMVSLNPKLVALVERARELATSGQLMEHSINNYARLWRRFEKWCEDMKLNSLPACSATVLLYVAYRADQGRTCGTINADLAAIRSYHLRAGFTNPADHDAIAMARKAVGRKHAAKGASPKKAHPLTLDEVRTMVKSLDQLTFRSTATEDLTRIRLKAVLLVTWFTGRRLDEIVRADLAWLTMRDGVQVLQSDHQKTKANGFSTAIDKIEEKEICPWTALQAWLQVSAPLREGVDRIFAIPKVTASGEIVLADKLSADYRAKMVTGQADGSSATEEEFAAQCWSDSLNIATKELRDKLIKWMRLAGIEPDSANRSLGGHSMRRGLITELRRAGVDSRVIANHVGLETLNIVEAYSDAAVKTNALDALNL